MEAATRASVQLGTTVAHDAPAAGGHPDDRIAAALAQLALHLRKMPPVAALAVRPLAFDGRALKLAAPLAANINDKGCAFGGSLCGMMTLAAWGWVTLHLQLAGLAAEVFVADSQVKYIAPLYEDLVAEAAPVEVDAFAAFADTLQRHGKARIQMRARVPMRAGGEAAVLSGRFVAMRPMR